MSSTHGRGAIAALSMFALLGSSNARAKGAAPKPAAAPKPNDGALHLPLTTFKLPEAGLVIIIGVDQFLDMGRTATNVIGNGIATAVVAKWEGELGPTTPEPEAAPEARPT